MTSQTPEPDPKPAQDGMEAASDRVVSLPDQAGDVASVEGAEDGDAPYENLWIPLIVVPAGIVMALVAIFALFGTIAADEKSVEDNLALVVGGGANEREQALFGLTRQAAENNAARAEGKELPYPMDGAFRVKLQKAAGDLDEDDHRFRLALAVLLGSLDDPQGIQLLTSFMSLGEAADEGGQLRIDAVTNLALLARTSPELFDAEALVAAAQPLLQNSDAGLRSICAPLLGELGSEAGREPLVGLVGDTDLPVRFSAALALAKLQPPGVEARHVLHDMIGPEIYTAARADDPTLFTRAESVSTYRQWAVGALARYGDPTDRALFEGLEGDADLRVREAAMIALRQPEEIR